MKIAAIFTFLLTFLFFQLNGQEVGIDEYGRKIVTDTISGVTITYLINQRQLAINFNNQSQQKRTLKIDWVKYQDLKSIAITNYGSGNHTKIGGLKRSGIKHIWFTECDITNFCKNNDIPKNLRGFYVWESHSSVTDTIFIPKIIEKFKRINHLSVGCCNLISFEKVDLSKLKKLDTLILEGPLYEVNSLTCLKGLSYLGIWNDKANDRINGWKSDSLKLILDTLLPDTKKETWCFPPNQQILLFDGKTKSIQNIVKGDTLLSYNFIRDCFAPNIVVEVIGHDEFNYPFCNVYSMDNLTASLDLLYLVNNKSVIATVNHPIISTNGSKIPLGDISTEEFVFYKSTKGIEKIQVEHKQFYSERTKVYNLITEGKNYFVNGYLFADK